MKLKAILTVAIIFAGLVSCKKTKEKCTYNCQDTLVLIEGTGFTDADLDTIEVRRYSKNGGFNNLEQATFVYDRIIGPSSNRIVLYRLENDSDWQIRIPATNKTYSITEIIDEGKYSDIADCETNRGCYNNIVSFKLDGVMKQGSITVISK